MHRLEEAHIELTTTEREPELDARALPAPPDAQTGHELLGDPLELGPRERVGRDQRGWRLERLGKQSVRGQLGGVPCEGDRLQPLGPFLPWDFVRRLVPPKRSGARPRLLRRARVGAPRTEDGDEASA